MTRLLSYLRRRLRAGTFTFSASCACGWTLRTSTWDPDGTRALVHEALVARHYAGCGL